MGGGISSLSKAVVIGPPTHPEANVDHTFIQLAVEEPVADWSNNCGNLSSAVGHFAVDEGLVPAKDGEVLVRIHQTNTKKIIHSRFTVQDGKAATAGDYVIAGVAGTGSRIRLDFRARRRRYRQTPADRQCRRHDRSRRRRQIRSLDYRCHVADRLCRRAKHRTQGLGIAQ